MLEKPKRPKILSPNPTPDSPEQLAKELQEHIHQLNNYIDKMEDFNRFEYLKILPLYPLGLKIDFPTMVRHLGSENDLEVTLEVYITGIDWIPTSTGYTFMYELSKNYPRAGENPKLVLEKVSEKTLSDLLRTQVYNIPEF